MAPRQMGSGKRAAKSANEEKREDALQAVVIADDFQTRFQPFILEKPRCLLPLANTPLIEYTLEFLAMNGVQEVFIYCGAHHEQIERYVHDSRWSPMSNSCPFTVLEFIRVADAKSVGDFLRDLDKRGFISGDFILVHGDVVSNIALDEILAAHRARREANRDSCMTMVLREAGALDHRTKSKVVTPIFVVDPTVKRCLHYEEMHPLQSDHYASLDPDILKNHAELEIRADLIDAEIDICTPDVLALWSESFDYELPRTNFLHGVLKDWELNGKLIHAEIVSDGYAARACDLQRYEAITRDVLAGWAFPFTPDCNLLRGQTFHLQDNNVYAEDEVLIKLGAVVSKSTLGRDTHVGAGSIVKNSVVGRNCKIGDNVRIENSFLFSDCTIEDDVVIERAIVADSVNIGKGVRVEPGALLSFGVQISEDIRVVPPLPISLLSHTLDPVSPENGVVGAHGRGARFVDPEEDALNDDEPARLQRSLIYSFEGLNISSSSVSTFADEDEFVSDDESETAAAAAGAHSSRSRLSSFASDDSTHQQSSSFHADAVHGLLEALRSTSGDFDSEKLEFMSLRLANNASDAAMRKAVATAFVRRGMELMNNTNNAETGGTAAAGLDPGRAAKQALTSKTGAVGFVSEVGVGGESVRDQVEFALAVQRACAASSARMAGISDASTATSRAGKLLAAMFQQMYDLDILEENGILKWWADERSSADGRGGGSVAMAAVRLGCQTLVKWLEEADEESDEDGDDDDSEDG